MQVDGIGEVGLTDSGGFPVVWLGGDCPIGQDPNQGGTNCYGPGDVLFDDAGQQYQIGSDWHVRALGDPFANQQTAAPAQQAETASGDVSQPSYTDPSGGGGGYGPYATPDPPQLSDAGTYVDSGELIHKQVDQYGNEYFTDLGPAPSDQAAAGATVVDNLYYVDHQHIINRLTYSDGRVIYQDTGVQVNLPDGTASTDIGGLQAAAGRSPAAPAAPAASRRAPTAADYCRGDRKTYTTVNGPRTCGQMVDELLAVGWQGVPPGSESPGSVANAYMQASGGPVAVRAPVGAPSVPGGPSGRSGPGLPIYGGGTPPAGVPRGTGGTAVPSTMHRPGDAQTPPGGTPPGARPRTTTTTPAVGITGDTTRWAQGVVTWLGRSDFVGGVPNAALVAAGGAAYYLASGRRRRRYR